MNVEDVLIKFSEQDIFKININEESEISNRVVETTQQVEHTKVYSDFVEARPVEVIKVSS